MGIKQSVVVPMLRGALGMKPFLREIAAIGYPAVEIWNRDEGFGDFAETARSAGLSIASMVGHTHVSASEGGHAECFSRERNHDRLEAELRESIDLAVEFGIPGLIVLAGRRNPGQSDIEALSVCARGLRRILPYAEERGVNLNMEILNTRIDHPGYLCDRVDWAAALCELTGSPRMKILFDIYHVQIMEGDIIRRLRAVAPLIGHYHTAGNPGRGPFDESQELNYRGICRAIAATGYTYYLGHEFKVAGDPIEALRAAYAICDV